MGKTGYFTHRECWRHEMGPGHPECPARLDAIEDRLLVTGVADALERHEAPQASLADIELAHDRMHVAALQGLTQRLIEEQQAGGPEYSQIDTDTSINSHTFSAALHAAGAALAATDAVMAGELENAFCAVRPPGHHATRHQAMGFCFFNNVAVGVKYALSRHHLKRVAVIDFDVHHGNGTQTVAESEPRLMFVSTHQAPLYPGTGARNETGINENVVNAPLPAGAGSAEWRRAMEERVLPALDAFAPELILVSAGFDAHKADPLAQMELETEDFAWAGRRLRELALRHCKGKLVSTLEGGYDLGALAGSAAAYLAALQRD